MRYTTFGRRTGLRVSEVALGTGNFFDTANGYQAGQSEVLLGEFIAAQRDDFVLATKYTMGTTPGAGVSHTGNNRKNMIRSVEDSLKRLNTERIDLLWAHIADAMTPMDEILRGFDGKKVAQATHVYF